MSLLFVFSILTKAILTALIVVLASVVGRFADAFWGALVACFPVSVGPAYVFLALQHGDAFIQMSALSGVVANAATAIFLIVYARNAVRSIWLNLGLAALSWAVCVLLLSLFEWTAVSAILLNLIVYVFGFWTTRKISRLTKVQETNSESNFVELFIQATSIALLVSFLILVSSIVGAKTTGMIAMFPVSLSGLILITRQSLGKATTATMATTALKAMLGYAFALAVLHLSIPFFGLSIALALALLVFGSWSIAVIAYRNSATIEAK